MDFADKRILLTQNSLAEIAGSEVVTLEIASYLLGQGARPTVYTYDFDQPMQGHFEGRGITVVTQRNNDLHTGDFDFVWVHHQVLPPNLIRELGDRSQQSRPAFIFNHMSPFDSLPLERPYLWGLEDLVAATTLFVSEETRLALSALYAGQQSFDLFPNPAPPEFADAGYVPAPGLRNVLITSNHIPAELSRARELLAARGIKTVHLGSSGDRLTVLTPAILGEFDLVVTIGKTVQYGLTMGVPVYVYDIHGGPGYLCGSNIAQAAAVNFSGRDCPRARSPESLVDDIMSGYAQAVLYQQSRRAEFVQAYSLDAVLPRVFEQAVPREIDADDRYVRYLETAECLAAQLIRSTRVEGRALKLYRQALDDVLNSRAYGVGQKIATPVRKARRVVQALRRS